MTSHKDVVLAVLGAATGLAGLVLVFLGILVSGFGSYDREGQDAARPRFVPAAWISVTAFLLGLVTVLLALAWLVCHTLSGLYWPLVGTFALEVAAVGVLSVWIVRQQFGRA